MELFIFIAFQLLTEVQSYKSPAVKVSPDVISESSSVEMICETPGDVPVNQCHFYPNRDEKNIKVSWRCELKLTGAEVLRWADVESPASVDINCFYTTNEEGTDKRSSRSPDATVKVLGLPQAKLTASASVINETDTVQLSCENNEDQKMEMECFFNINGRENSEKRSSSCQLSLTGSEISIWSEGQSSSVNITCFYTVKKSQVHTTYPHSDPVTVTIQISTATSTGKSLTKAPETFVKASTPVKTAVIETLKPKTWLIMALAATSGGVFLSGLMGICLFCFRAKLKRKSLMVTSVAAVPQNPVSDDIDDYQYSSEENEDAVYCTIPDDSDSHELDSLAQTPNHP